MDQIMMKFGISTKMLFSNPHFDDMIPRHLFGLRTADPGVALDTGTCGPQAKQAHFILFYNLFRSIRALHYP